MRRFHDVFGIRQPVAGKSLSLAFPQPAAAESGERLLVDFANTITWTERTTAFSWVSGMYGSGGFTLSNPATNDSPGGSYSGRSPGPCLSGCPICPLCVRFSGRGDEAYDANVKHFGGGAGAPLYR